MAQCVFRVPPIFFPIVLGHFLTTTKPTYQFKQTCDTSTALSNVLK